jgi:hypothetical protein
MGVGRALVTAINEIDAQAYGPNGKFVPKLTVELDVPNFTQMLSQKGYHVETIQGAALTAQALLDGLARAASAAQAGDIFVLTYSGHGGRFMWQQNTIVNAMLLRDRLFMNKELHAVWNSFKPGVRVVFVDASCQSQSMLYWDQIPPGSINIPDFALPLPSSMKMQPLRIPNDLVQKLYEANSNRYDALIAPGMRMDITTNAAIIELAACQDDQTAESAVKLGTFFCYGIERVLQKHQSPNYTDFISRVSAVVRHYVAQQSPCIGKTGDYAALLAQQPFQI